MADADDADDLALRVAERGRVEQHRVALPNAVSGRVKLAVLMQESAFCRILLTEVLFSDWMKLSTLNIGALAPSMNPAKSSVIRTCSAAIVLICVMPDANHARDLVVEPFLAFAFSNSTALPPRLS